MQFTAHPETSVIWILKPALLDYFHKNFKVHEKSPIYSNW